MSESRDVYREFKAGQQGNVTRLPKPHTSWSFRSKVVPVTFVVTKRVGFAKRRPPISGDYSAFKNTMAVFAEDIKLEIREQHQRTRAEVQTVRRDVLDAVKASPAEYVKLLCELGSLFLVFSLAVRFALKIELVNPAFAVFMLFACTLYWSMASMKQRSEKRSKHSQA